MDECLTIQWYRGEELVDSFEIGFDCPRGAKGVFDHIKRLPMVTKGLEDGCLVVDLKTGDDLLEDPITIDPDTVAWFLYTFLRLSRSKVKRLTAAWRNDRRSLAERCSR